MVVMKKVRLNESELTELVHQILERKNKHVTCERCDWEWDITAEDEDPYLCHMCGHRNHKSENKEGVGAYDAPAFQVEPDHVTFKHEYNEDIVILDDDDESTKDNKKDEPIKILKAKLVGKPFQLTMGVDDQTTVEYQIKDLALGKNYPSFFTRKEDMDEKYVSGLIEIQKVLYRGQDVTELVKNITNSGGAVKNEVKDNVWLKVQKLSKHFDLYPSKFRTWFKID